MRDEYDETELECMAMEGGGDGCCRADDGSTSSQ